MEIAMMEGVVMKSAVREGAAIESMAIKIPGPRTWITTARTQLFALLLTLVLPASLDAQVTAERITRAADEPHNWLTYSGGYASQRYSTLEISSIRKA